MCRCSARRVMSGLRRFLLRRPHAVVETRHHSLPVACLHPCVPGPDFELDPHTSMPLQKPLTAVMTPSQLFTQAGPISNAVAAAVTADLATAAAAIAATFGRGRSQVPAHLLPATGADGLPGTQSSAERVGGAFRPPQLLVPELSTSQTGSYQPQQSMARVRQQQQQQQLHSQSSPLQMSSEPLSLQQQLQQRQAQHPSPLAPAVPEWAQQLPPDVQAELLRSIATAPLEPAPQHGPAGG